MATNTYPFQNSFHPANMIVSACNQLDLEQLKTILEHAKNVLEVAKSAAEFAKGRDILVSAIEKFDGAIERVDRLLKRGKSILGDIEAGCEIIKAMDVLMDWEPNSSKVSRDEAAKAFDRLFGGVAHFFEKLPFPASFYARVLNELAKQHFFEVVSGYVDPTERPSGHDQWDQIEDQGGSLRRH